MTTQNSDAARESARQGDGKFGTQALSEAEGVSLTPPGESVGKTGLTREQIEEALGCGLDDISTDEQRLLTEVLLDPKVAAYNGYDTDPEAMLEEYEAFDGNDNYSAQEVANRLSARYEIGAPEGGRSGFSFGFDASGEGEVGAYNVSEYLGEHGYLMAAHDIKYLNADRRVRDGATGLRQALAVASVIDSDYDSVRSRAQRLGLTGAQGGLMLDESEKDRLDFAIEHGKPAEVHALVEKMMAARQTAAAAAPHPPVWPQDDDERAAFEDYKSLAAEGSIAESFRDFYTNRQAEQAADQEG